MNVSVIVDFLIGFLILAGALLCLIAAFGVIRLPDVYTRNHAASKAATLGVMFILLGTFIYFYAFEGHFNSRLILGIVFLFMTSPISGHLINRAAYNSGVKLWDKSVRDDLKKYNSNLMDKSSAD
ncbi:multicomponent Na+:H+ antiporter subunit G [Bacillus benzoevorans]|uniref:Multicomponent Na+:H+ antiporter subunit G n=1 Tax=Bacillus benzoevorans TaxID=1456 RepID=A0A7X0HSX8_9BACI|nr:monovalent cation/H(+) antiporter subunit G [Bacillus benzoevorans]MBB6446257.1 multicomponent Na+:H+ antiporter subunit G [Bacillus benzoevorans]